MGKQEFRPAEETKTPRKIEQKITAQHFEAARLQHAMRFNAGKRNGIPIEVDTTHHVTRSRIPRIILPKGKETLWARGYEAVRLTKNGHWRQISQKWSVLRSVGDHSSAVQGVRQMIDQRSHCFQRIVRLVSTHVGQTYLRTALPDDLFFHRHDQVHNSHRVQLAANRGQRLIGTFGQGRRIRKQLVHTVNCPKHYILEINCAAHKIASFRLTHFGLLHYNAHNSLSLSQRGEPILARTPDSSPPSPMPGELSPPAQAMPTLLKPAEGRAW